MWWVVWLSRRLMFLYLLESLLHARESTEVWTTVRWEIVDIECWISSRFTTPACCVGLEVIQAVLVDPDVLSHAEGVVGYGTVTRQLGGFTTPACCVGYWKWFRQCWLTHDVLSHASPRQRVGYWNCHTPAKGGSPRQRVALDIGSDSGSVGWPMMCFHTLHHASVLDIGSELVDLGFPTLKGSV